MLAGCSWLVLLALVPLAPSAAAEDCKECPDGGTVWHVDASSTAPVPDGITWATAYPDLQDAIDAAGAGDCIWVAAGRYFPGASRGATFAITKSLYLYGGWAGDEACFDARANQFAGTRLSGEIGNPQIATDNAYTVVTIDGSLGTVDVVLDGFNVRDAYNDSVTGTGGGVAALGASSVEVRNCTIRNNWADLGAGLYTDGGGLDIALSEFVSNDAWTDGGGLWAATVTSALPGAAYGANVYNTLFKNNSADRAGGGFYVGGILEDEEVLFVNCLFHGNGKEAPADVVVTDEGGAGYIDEATTSGFSQPGRVILTNCTVSDNHVVTTGAAFMVEEFVNVLPGELTYNNSIIHGNLPSTALTINGTSGVGGANTLLENVAGGLLCTPSVACTIESNCTVFDCDPQFLTGSFIPDPSASPAVDQGLDLFVRATHAPDVFDLDGDDDTSEPVPFDYAGNARVQGTGACGGPADNCVDMGAYESAP